MVINKGPALRTADETLALAKTYLEKHRAPEADFGLGPFLARGHPFELSVSERTFLDGSFSLVFSEGYLDCRTIAEDVYDDIRKNNPELYPRITAYMHHGVHNWVEISDPLNGAVVQIDGTPWYGSLDPGHLGRESGSGERCRTLRFSQSDELPFSVRTTALGMVSVYLTGHSPIAISDDPSAPDYRFRLVAVLSEGFGGRTESFFCISIDLGRLEDVQRSLRSARDMKELCRSRLMKTGLHVPGREDIPVHLDSLGASARESKDEAAVLIEEIRRGLPMMLPLLERLVPVRDKKETRRTHEMPRPSNIEREGMDSVLDSVFISDLRTSESAAFRKRVGADARNKARKRYAR